MRVLGILVLTVAAIVLSVRTFVTIVNTPTVADQVRYDPDQNAAAKARWAEEDRRALADNIKIAQWTWHKSGLGAVMIANFTLKNSNTFAVKDIVVQCKLVALSGTVIDSNTRTIYQAIMPNASIKVNDFNMGFIHTQSATSSCRVESFA